MRQLELKKCLFKEINSSLFRSLPNLELLSILDSIYIPTEIFKDLNLKSLSLFNSNIPNFNFLLNFTNLVNLRLIRIGLNQNNIDGIFINLKSLRHLDLGWNEIETIGTWIDSLGNLRELFLGSNKIKSSEFNRLSRLIFLEKLNLDYNFIEILKEGQFSSLVNMRSLSLNGLKLQLVEPNVLQGLNKLEELALDHIPIKHIFILTENMKFLNLKKISLRYSKNENGSSRTFGKFDSNFFQKFPSLIELDLCGNGFIDLNENTFLYLKNLMCLNLSSIYLEPLQPNIFINQFHLQKLSLAYNGLLQLEEDSFNGLANLRELDLRGNILNTINFSILDKLVKLKRICLEYNPVMNDHQVLIKFKCLRIKLIRSSYNVRNLT